MIGENIRLVRLPLSAKLLVTLFLLIVGPGYLFGTANILFKHQNADGEEGLTLDDLRATFHGMTKTIQPEDKVTVNSTMLAMVRPGGDMREYLEKGGEPAVRGLITWLENGAREEEFTQADLAQEGDPSAQAIIKAQCVECHRADGGEMEDLPYAETAEDDPQYARVIRAAKPDVTVEKSGVQTREIKPASEARLVHITHVHILTMPVFAFLVGALFLMTGLPSGIKVVVGPLPMLAVLLDIGGWWAARWVEQWIYVIAAAGGVFGALYALQILCILGSLWLGRAGD